MVRSRIPIRRGSRFGFYDDDSYERLSDRELRLQVIHSDPAPLIKGEIPALTSEDRIEAAKKYCQLSELSSFINGERPFNVSVYAVRGNHEDKHVVEQLMSGDIQVENLNMLECVENRGAVGRTGALEDRPDARRNRPQRKR